MIRRTRTKLALATWALADLIWPVAVEVPEWRKALARPLLNLGLLLWPV